MSRFRSHHSRPVSRRRTAVKFAIALAAALMLVVGGYLIGEELEKRSYREERQQMSENFGLLPTLEYQGQTYMRRPEVTTMLLMGVAAVCQRIMGVAADPSLTDLANNAGMPGRVFSTFENPNNYAEAIVLLLPLCLSYCFMVEERKPRGRLLAGLLIPLLALVMTYSRSSWVSFLLVVVLIVFLLDRRFLPALPPEVRELAIFDTGPQVTIIDDLV